jgi:hypothetical protein
MLANDHIPYRGSRQQIKYGIRIRALSLLVAATLCSLVATHAAVEGGAGGHVEGLLENDRLLGHGELCHGKGEARRGTLPEVALGAIGVALCAVARVLPLHEAAAGGGPVEDVAGGEEGKERGNESCPLFGDGKYWRFMSVGSC